MSAIEIKAACLMTYYPYCSLGRIVLRWWVASCWKDEIGVVSCSAWREALTLGIEIHQEVEDATMVCDLELVQRWGAWQPIGLATAAISVWFR